MKRIASIAGARFYFSFFEQPQTVTTQMKRAQYMYSAQPPVVVGMILHCTLSC